MGSFDECAIQISPFSLVLLHIVKWIIVPEETGLAVVLQKFRRFLRSPGKHKTLAHYGLRIQDIYKLCSLCQFSRILTSHGRIILLGTRTAWSANIPREP